MRKIIGLCGPRGAGKDTVAGILVEHGFRQLSFAEPLYQEVSAAFGVTIEDLQRRETKETPLQALAFRKCLDVDFVVAAARASNTRPSYAAFIDAPRSPREILQLWGTEYRRQCFGDDYWRRKVAETVNANPDQSFCISDVRFKNEASLVEGLGGEMWRVRRANGETVDARDLHPSEIEVASIEVKLEINNSGSIGDLSEKVRDAVSATSALRARP